ncbi:enoyl-CoA hydratase/isomerase family protein [Brevirhabdus sp.]|uniref:enoyl-CoA hydratase/isomerase family protein n=1 Tax=Brevirhabdus sp. TaxID=2004514 RepID=UPI004059F467
MIALDKGARRWTVTLRRAEKANSLTRDMLADLARVARDAARAELGAFVLTGEGRVFSAGADLDQARAGLALDPLWEEVSGAIADLPCLSIAALNGTLAGGAFGMALACDLRIAVPQARFFYPVMKLGFLPQPSDPRRMEALMGPARSKLILMGGARLSAAEALQYGLIDRIVDEGALSQGVDAILADAEAAAPAHVAGIKAMVR